MESEKCYYFVRKSYSSDEEYIIEFEYAFSSNITCFYSFLRPKTELVSAFYKKIELRITKIKYKKSSKKMKNERIADHCNLKVINVSTLENVSPESLTIANLLNGEFCLVINEFVYFPLIFPIWIKSCTLPKFFMVESPIVPLVEIENGVLSDLNVVWSVKGGRHYKDWTEISFGSVFTPLEGHVNCHIKMNVSSNLICSKQKFSITSLSDIQPLPKTDYQLMLDVRRMRLVDDGMLRICTYNVLSSMYADTVNAKTELYKHCPSEYLSQPYRQCLLLYEIIHIQADVILLQEVDTSFYQKFLQPSLSIIGYDGVFQCKFGTIIEGSAIFFRRSRFALIENISIPLISAEIFDNMKSFLEQKNYLMERWQSLWQCMAGCVLRLHESNALLVIANNHLFYHPKYEVLRLFQAAIVMKNVEIVKQKYPQSMAIVCGDFNASYEDATIQFILDGVIDYSEDNESNVIHLEHGIKNFVSAFRNRLEFTNFTLGYVGILDHLFYEEDLIKLIQTYELPSFVDLQTNVALPNKYHPSDHLPLVADFIIK